MATNKRTAREEARREIELFRAQLAKTVGGERTTRGTMKDPTGGSNGFPLTAAGRLNQALRALTRAGWVTRGGAWICCASCGHAELERVLARRKTPAVGYLFWHVQTEEAVWKGLELREPLHLQWRGDAAAAVEIIRRSGLIVTHTGDPGRCIEVAATTHKRSRLNTH